MEIEIKIDLGFDKDRKQFFLADFTVQTQELEATEAGKEQKKPILHDLTLGVSDSRKLGKKPR